MSKSKYKLQTVLTLRDKGKQEAAQRVAASRALLAEAETELSRRARAVMDCREQQKSLQVKLLEQMKNGAQAQHVANGRLHLKDLRLQEQELIERVAQQQMVLARAEVELENALVSLVETSKELQAIEKHREEWTRQTRRVEQRREQKLSDEIGSIIHEKQRKDES